jgi:ribonuclease D
MAPLPVPPPGAALVDRAESLDALCTRLAPARRLALDTEANSLHAYRERTCLVQLSTDTESAILDVLALPSLEPLAPLLSRPDLEVVLHGGDYDVSVLARDHRLSLGRVFDTMVAATLLGEPRVGLADLVGTHLGVTLDKRLQKADWGRRPLGPEHLAYLEGDTRWLLALADLLGERLAAQDLLEEAEIEFRRILRRRPRPRPPEHERWREQDGADDLDGTGRSLLAAAWAWREHEAEQRDVPSFKVLPPQALVLLARRAAEVGPGPRALDALLPRDAARHGQALRLALERGWAQAEAGDAPPASERPRLDEAARALLARKRRREEALRGWRKAEAAQRQVPNVVVLPNPALEWLVEQGRTSLEELAQHPDVGPKRAARYGAALVGVLESLPP